MRLVARAGGHPNIVALLGEYWEAGRGAMHIVMELAGGGDLFDHVIEHGAMDEAQAGRVVHDVAQALRFLHARGFVHQDVKPENVLFDGRSGAAKLADFGCCVATAAAVREAAARRRKQQQQQQQQQQQHADSAGAAAVAAAAADDDEAGQLEQLTSRLYVLGTTGYMPPEWQRAAAQEHMHESDPATDMWGLGCVLFVLLAGYHPFDPTGAATVEEVEERVLTFTDARRGGGEGAWRLDYSHPNWEHVGVEAKGLVKGLLRADPAKRLTAEQVATHPWVRHAQRSRFSST